MIMQLLELIHLLKELPQDKVVVNVEPDGGSYRGYYQDFYLEINRSNESDCTVKMLREYLNNSVLYEYFTGYKGGSFNMTGDVDVYIASYGNTGNLISGVSVTEDGVMLEAEECGDEE